MKDDCQVVSNILVVQPTTYAIKKQLQHTELALCKSVQQLVNSENQNTNNDGGGGIAVKTKWIKEWIGLFESAKINLK